MPDSNRQLIDNIWAAAIDRRTGAAGRKTVAELAAAVGAAVPAGQETTRDDAHQPANVPHAN